MQYGKTARLFLNLNGGNTASKCDGKRLSNSLNIGMGTKTPFTATTEM